MILSMTVLYVAIHIPYTRKFWRGKILANEMHVYSIATTDHKRKYLEGKKLAKGILFVKFANFPAPKVSHVRYIVSTYITLYMHCKM